MEDMEDMEDALPELRDGTKTTQEQIGLLRKRIEELNISNATLLAENEMFEQFISRLDPQDLVAQGAGRRRRSRFNISDQPPPLTSEQKLCVAQREVTELQHDVKKLRKECEGTEGGHRASVEEAELCLTEMRKMKSGRERRANKLAKDDRRGKLEEEEDKIKASLLRKLAQRKQALKDQEKTLQKKLQKKQQMEIDDYERLLIPSSQVFAREQSDEGLHELQVKSFKSQCLLKSHQEKLQSATVESAHLDKAIPVKRKMLATFEKEIRRVEEECLKTETKNKRLERQLDEYEPCPDPTQYILLKERHKKLQSSVHTWERNIDIAKLALKLNSKLRRELKANVTPASGAEAEAQSDQGHIPVNPEQN